MLKKAIFNDDRFRTRISSMALLYNNVSCNNKAKI